MSEVDSLYRWGSWKQAPRREFARIRVRQKRDFSDEVELEDHILQETLTPQELSVLQSVLGAASWRALQMSHFAIDLSLLLSATARPLVQDLPDANKLDQDMRRSSLTL